MMRKVILSCLLIAGLNVVAEKKGHLGERIQGKKPSLMWSKGLMIGKVGDYERRGFIFKTQEAKMQLGDFSQENQSGKKNYVPREEDISFASEEAKEQMKLLDLSETVVLEYKKLHPFNIFRLHDSPKMALSIRSLQSFEETESFELYGKELQFERGRERGKYGEGKKSGKIVSVNRWGIFTGYACSVEVHLGGTKKERRVTGYRRVGRGDYATDVPIYSTFEVPNIDIMNTYDEAGCRFLEDVLVSQSSVELETRTSWFEIWNSYATTITSAKIIQ